jgi:SAM-dependent methyltransferase
MRFNEKRFATEYDRRLTDEGYPGSLLGEVAGELTARGRVLDVGAGTGHFTIPLAAAGHEVTAIEPSPAMMEILAAKIVPELAPRIHLCLSGWDSWEGDRSDALICVHAIYGMKNVSAALEKMKRLSEKAVLLVKADRGSRTLSEIIRNSIGTRRCSTGFSTDIESALNGLGIPFTARQVRQVRTSRFADLDAEAEYYRHHLGLEADAAGAIRKIIASHALREAGEYSFEAVYCDRLFAF